MSVKLVIIFILTTYLRETFFHNRFQGNAWCVLVFTQHVCKWRATHGAGGIMVQTPIYKMVNSIFYKCVLPVETWFT